MLSELGWSEVTSSVHGLVFLQSWAGALLLEPLLSMGGTVAQRNPAKNPDILQGRHCAHVGKVPCIKRCQLFHS